MPSGCPSLCVTVCVSQRDFRAQLRSLTAIFPYPLNNCTLSWGSTFKFQGLQVSFDASDHLPPQCQNYTCHEDPQLLKLCPGCPSTTYTYVSPNMHTYLHTSHAGVGQSMCFQMDTHLAFRGVQLKVQQAKMEQKTQRHTKPIQFSLYQKPRIFFSPPSPTHRRRSCSSSSSAFPSASPPPSEWLYGCLSSSSLPSRTPRPWLPRDSPWVPGICWAASHSHPLLCLWIHIYFAWLTFMNINSFHELRQASSRDGRIFFSVVSKHAPTVMQLVLWCP